ncbi:MAG: sigma-70 family RNA polymerase sigma factor [Bacteroidales bacterium]|nr:sigma-70 family RNA polymerase sigma factor [Bacteroidales bacterium]
MFLFKRNTSERRISKSSLSDEEIIARYRESGDTGLVGDLYMRYTHLLSGVCLKYLKDREEAKDMVMEVFEDLFEKLKENEISNFRSWIYTVTKNQCLMKLRKENQEKKQKGDFYEINKEEFMESSGILHLFEETGINDKVGRLGKGMEQLNEEQRICVELVYFENKSYLEVSRITGYSMKQVKSYVQNGKRNLKIYINGE